MQTKARTTLGLILLAAIILGMAWAMPAAAIQVGDRAPHFLLPSTTGKPIALSDFLGKRMVLIEFYHADFGPT